MTTVSTGTAHKILLWSVRWARHVACIGDRRESYRVLMGKPEGERALGRPGYKLDDNIKMDLKKTEYEGVEWITVVQDGAEWRLL
jgi:hypothetical protein